MIRVCISCTSCALLFVAGNFLLLFEHRLFPGQDWEAPFYRSLAEEEGVDAVLLLGGATSTLIAGQIAVARRLPILAVDEFGGSAAKIWNQLAQASPEKPYYSWGTRPAAAFVAQLKNECAAVTTRRKEARRREQVFARITAQRHQTVYATGAFVVLLAALFFGMVYTPFPSAYPLIMFIGLIAAGATGTLVRALLGDLGRTIRGHRFCLAVSPDLSSASPTSSRNGSARRGCLRQK